MVKRETLGDRTSRNAADRAGYSGPKECRVGPARRVDMSAAITPARWLPCRTGAMADICPSNGCLTGVGACPFDPHEDLLVPGRRAVDLVDPQDLDSAELVGI